MKKAELSEVMPFLKILIGLQGDNSKTSGYGIPMEAFNELKTELENDMRLIITPNETKEVMCLMFVSKEEIENAEKNKDMA